MKLNIKEIVLTSIFTALTAVGAFITIPIGPVPIILQSFFVLLSGMLLGPKLGALSQVLYIALALIGLPIFSGFSGGLQILLKPSFGFAIGFIFAAYIIGYIIHGNMELKNKAFISSILGSIIIYLFGLPYMYFILNIIMEQDFSFINIINMGCLLFIPGDLLKLIIANIIYKRLATLQII